MVIAPTVGAGAHTDDPSWIRHLVVNLAKSGGHLVGESAGNDHDVGLTGRSAEDYAEAILVVTRGGEVHHFNGAAGESKGHGPEGALAGPIGDLIGRCPESIYISQPARARRKTVNGVVHTRQIAWPLLSSPDLVKAPLVLVYQWR